MNEKFSIKRWLQPYLPNPAMLRLLFVQDGYNVQQWCERSGTLFGVQKFDEDKSHWVVSGSVEITIVAQVGVIGQFVYTLGAGDRDFIKAGTYFSKRILGDENVLYLIGEKKSPEETAESGEPEFASSGVAKMPKAKKVKSKRTKSKKGSKKTKGKNEKTTNSGRA